jgi:copper(I)-binding protein
MNGKRFLLGLALASMASATIAAPSDKAAACHLEIKNAWVRAAPPMSMQLAGYASLENHCAKPMTVASVSSRNFGMAMIHETVVENGVSKMRHVAALTVPAKGSVAFTPGRWHLMLMMPARELKPGDKVSLTFGLASGEQVVAEFPVLREAPAPGR